MPNTSRKPSNATDSATSAGLPSCDPSFRAVMKLLELVPQTALSPQGLIDPESIDFTAMISEMSEAILTGFASWQTDDKKTVKLAPPSEPIGKVLADFEKRFAPIRKTVADLIGDREFKIGKNTYQAKDIVAEDKIAAELISQVAHIARVVAIKKIVPSEAKLYSSCSEMLVAYSMNWGPTIPSREEVLSRSDRDKLILTLALGAALDGFALSLEGVQALTSKNQKPARFAQMERTTGIALGSLSLLFPKKHFDDNPQFISIFTDRAAEAIRREFTRQNWEFTGSPENGNVYIPYMLGRNKPKGGRSRLGLAEILQKPRDENIPGIRSEVVNITKLPRFSDLIGIDQQQKLLSSAILRRLFWDENEPIAGHIVLHGPTGGGKTALMRAAAREAVELAQSHEKKVRIFEADLSLIYAKYLGETEQRLQEFFNHLASSGPAIVLIDNMHSDLGKHAGDPNHGVHQFIANFDRYVGGGLIPLDNITFIGTTDRLNHIDSALTRPGKFGTHIHVPLPSRATLRNLLGREIDRCKKMGVICTADESTLDAIAKQHTGLGLAPTAWSCGDVPGMFQAFHDQRLILKLKNESPPELTDAYLRKLHKDYLNTRAVPSYIEVSANDPFPEGSLITISDPSKLPSFDQIIGSDNAKQELTTAVLKLLHSDKLRMGTHIDHILLEGVPGVGKSMLARATARHVMENFQEFGVKFTEANLQDLYHKLVGNTNLFLKSWLQRLKEAAPIVVYLNEIDGTLVQRAANTHEITRQFISTFLSMMEGSLYPIEGILFIGDTNKKDLIDPAAIRSGRFGTHVHICYPTAQELHAIMRNNFAKFSEFSSDSLDQVFSKLAHLHSIDHAPNKALVWTGADVRAVFEKLDGIVLIEELNGKPTKHISSTLFREAYARHLAVRIGDNPMVRASALRFFDSDSLSHEVAEVEDVTLL